MHLIKLTAFVLLEHFLKPGVIDTLVSRNHVTTVLGTVLLLLWAERPTTWALH